MDHVATTPHEGSVARRSGRDTHAVPHSLPRSRTGFCAHHSSELGTLPLQPQLRTRHMELKHRHMVKFRDELFGMIFTRLRRTKVNGAQQSRLPPEGEM